MRWATVALRTVALLTLVACNDLRDFRGDWRGPRVGDAAELRLGIAEVSATLSVDQIDEHGLMARLSIEQLLPETTIESLKGAEADVLAGMTFGGSPLRVYLAFVEVPDAGGNALVVVSLYNDHRIELRVLRGGTAPLYGIFALVESTP